MGGEHERAGWGNLSSGKSPRDGGGGRTERRWGTRCPEGGDPGWGHPIGEGVESQCPEALRMLFSEGVGRFGGQRPQTARKGDLFLSQTCPNEKCVTDDSDMDGSITEGKR